MRPCPYCGGKIACSHGQARGTVIQYHDEDGYADWVGTDRMWFDLSDVIRCGECDKIRRDLVLIDRKIVDKESEG